MVALSNDDRAVGARVAAAVAEVYEVQPGQVLQPRRISAAVSDAKAAVAIVLKQERGWANGEIGRLFGMVRYSHRGELRVRDTLMQAAVAAGVVALEERRRLRPLAELESEVYELKARLRRVEHEIGEWHALEAQSPGARRAV